MIAIIARMTARALLARRRAVLMLLLAAVPVLVAMLVRLRGFPGDPAERTAEALEPLIVRTLLPLVTLVFGTAALGAEIEDGSAIHLLTKPVERWRIVAGKLIASAPIAAAIVAASAALTGLLIGGGPASGVTLAVVVAVVVGAAIYTTVFVALSLLTSRALIIGLVYVALWEGALGGLFAGTRVLSIREYVVGIAAGLEAGGAIADSSLAPATLVVGAAAIAVTAFVIAVRRLETFRLTAGD